MKRHTVRQAMSVSVFLLGAALSATTVQAAVPAGTAEATVAQPGESQPQVKDDLFAGTEKFAKNASDVTEVNLDPSMLGAVSTGKADGADIARKLDFIVVHSYTYDQPGMYRQEDLEEYRGKLAGSGWKCFIHERSKQESSDICQRTGSDPETHELAILTAEPKELTFVHLKGRMSLGELSMKGKMATMGGGMMLPFMLGDTGSKDWDQGSRSVLTPQQQQELNDLKRRLNDSNHPISDTERRQDEARIRTIEMQARIGKVGTVQ